MGNLNKPSRMLRGKPRAEVSRETVQVKGSVEHEDTTQWDADIPVPADVAVCAIARRTGFMLRSLLEVWTSTIRSEPSSRQERIHDAIEAAADLLVAIYAEPDVEP